MDENTRIKNRIHNTHDLNTLWQKLRDEGWQVWEDEGYINNILAPYHLYYIDRNGTTSGASIEVLFREKTERELAEDRELGVTPFKQEVEWVRY